MAKTIKDHLNDITDRFKKVSNIPQQSIANIEKVNEAARKAASEAKNEKA